jgi:PTH2 family peptidyl-tRNA hydrolase
MESRATELPSVWAVAFGASVVAGLAGYFLGTASSIGIFGSNHQQRVVSSNGAQHEKAHDGSESDDDNASESDLDDSEDDQEINGFEDSTEECKLVLVVRTDLGMTKGTYHIFFAINQHHTLFVSTPHTLPYRTTHTLCIFNYLHPMVSMP